MPIAAILYHCELSRICKKSELKILMVLKYLLYGIFYVILTFSFFYEMKVFANVNLFVVSSLTAGYSYAIFNTKMF
jgi:hypothetical protein